eukprot:582619-Amphidinium_carterae.1
MGWHKQGHSDLVRVSTPFLRARKGSGNQHAKLIRSSLGGKRTNREIAKDREASSANHSDPAMTRYGKDSSSLKPATSLIELILSSTTMEVRRAMKNKFSTKEGEAIGDLITAWRADILPMLGESSTGAKDTRLATVDLDVHGVKELMQDRDFNCTTGDSEQWSHLVASEL